VDCTRRRSFAAQDQSGLTCKRGGHDAGYAGAALTRAAGFDLHTQRADGRTPSDTQARAIADIKEWFKNRTDKQQIFRLFGYAGTGKSTVLKFALDELGLEPHKGNR
jgi:hypothetical protein